MIVDRAFDNDENLGAPKKSRDNDPRYRVAYLPERTWKLLEYWIARRQEAEGNPGLLFPYRGHAITKHFLGSRFDVGLENAGISRVGRNLTPHSLRYTYDTKMRGILPGDVLREFIGHRSEAMTDHYDRATLRPVLEVRLSQLAGQKGAVERFWE
jgi:integrase